MKSWLRVIDRISDCVGKSCSFLILGAALLVVFGVIMRYFVGSPLSWVLELTKYLCVATYMLGGAYAQLSDDHIRIAVLYRYWRPRTRVIVDLMMAPIFYIGLGLLAWYGLDYTITGLVRGETSGTLWDPVIWPIRMLIPLGAILLMLQGTVTYVRSFHIARRGP